MEKLSSNQNTGMTRKQFVKGMCAAVVAGMVVPLAACGGTRGDDASKNGSSGSSKVSVGISMPEQQLERWQIDGDNLKKKLEEYGYEVTLQFADGKTDLQSSQIQNMANQGANYIVVASIDGTATGAAVEQAAANGAKIIAYDRLIMNTDAVDYYTTFSLDEVGKMQGRYIVDKLGLEDGKKGPFNVELMSGSPTDNNAKYYYQGSWSVLGTYFDSGVLKSKSGKIPTSQDEWQSIGIDNWDRQKGQAEMENRINSFYNDGTKLDAVLAPNDAIALGTVNAVEGAGWSYFPIITGQDAEKANVQAIVQGKQAMTVYKDTRELAKTTAELIKDMVDGKKPEAKDTFNNGNKDVPSVLLKPISVDKSNVKKELVDSGYISAADAGL
ncbi:monosaccharide ABC transporter substrate-binding protein, CUT2 family [Coriobacterium glomerans PW2]|uniref:Monosaccharide ABC transporter substrate-binding protein, CUT2 family n=1 Tax=Coriobacterium glomerans (strain ATCC 49209 / DSM 20642 / JCM 10262 / PW2) TaxID=700015 RepID=F2NB72_CORGP|nr:sugar-binding protein [Coriobacterium glomerans]AEB07823.1 monosaccharide ABC transporter substrate-binding protein, CUT2 family [Coriobacterium glomerans PW2]